MSSNTPAADPPSSDPFASPSVPAPASPEAPVAFPPPEFPTPGLARGTSAPGAEAERAAAPAPDPTGSRPDAPNGELAGTARTRRPRTGIVILAVLLAVVVVAGGLGFFWLATQLQEARTQIGDQQQQITDQQRRLDEQQEMIDRKEEFGAAMDDLYGTVDTLVGLPYATIVPWNRVENLAESAWNHRRNANGLAQDVEVAKDLTTEISGLSAGVADQAASNASGTAWEATLDSLGRGWVSTVFDDTTPCGATALACVTGAEPFTVHVRADTRTDPAMTDWIRTGAAYHEYAHVLQFTNPGPTDAALASFGGDVETMADCYALTFLDGWSLDHEVSIDEYSYYEVSVGYGYTCDASQRQVIRDWVGRLGVTRQTVGG